MPDEPVCAGRALRSPSRDPVSVVAEQTESDVQVLAASGIPYRTLNAQVKALVAQGARTIRVRGVTGQRYIGTNLRQPVHITIEGVPGNDLGAFMDGPHIEVLGDAQDGCGNTMNDGSIVIHGSAGDIVGHSMRGGKIFVRDNVGYRVGIHMKEYGSVRPVIVVGGTAQHFLGEYMAGGVMVVLGRQLESTGVHPSRYVGTGMHGGVIYMRGNVQSAFLGKEVGVARVDEKDEALLRELVGEYAQRFAGDAAPRLARQLLDSPFTRLLPLTQRPYGTLYAY